MNKNWAKTCGLKSPVGGFGWVVGWCEHSWVTEMELHPNNMNSEDVLA
jgi:hypothetical protein